MEIGQELILTIEDLDFEGKGISHYDNQIIFVENALPGEVIKASVTAKSKNVVFAKTMEVLTPSKDRITPLCPHYEACGGCDLMHMSYEKELILKKEKVKKTLKKIANLEPIVKDTIPSDKLNHYRNKVIIPFGMKDGQAIYGFYEKRTHKIVERESCLIEPLIINDILKDIKDYLQENNISIYNEKTHRGTFRNVMARITSDEKIMLVFVVTKLDIKLKFLAHKLMEQYNIHSIYLNINDKQTTVILGDKYILIQGETSLTENILGLNFEVSPATFLQVNHSQCEKLYAKAIEYANLTGKENVIDAYCGMGSITLNLAKNANHVYGIEVVPKAILNANKNKQINEIENVTFLCGKCEEEIESLASKTNIDVIIFDPPRKGCEQKFLDTVIKMKIPRIVYISCNIATAARDIKYLVDEGYELKEITPVDMFTYSSHVETVVLMSRVNK